MEYRPVQSKNVRVNAADLAFLRGQPRHFANGEEIEHRRSDGQPSFIANFTKGLPHDDRGLLRDPAAYAAFVRAVDSGRTEDFQATPLGPGPFDAYGRNSLFENGSPVHDWRSLSHRDKRTPVRAWESQGAGLTFDLQGPDAQAVTMPPAPRLDSQELAAEIAEVYWMALLRDVWFDAFATDPQVAQAQRSLASLAWFRTDSDGKLTNSDRSEAALRRRRLLVLDGGDSMMLESLVWESKSRWACSKSRSSPMARTSQ